VTASGARRGTGGNFLFLFVKLSRKEETAGEIEALITNPPTQMVTFD
jgi:hypothetical protein